MIAVIRLRGVQNIKEKIVNTFKLLRLNKSNHCIILPEEPVYIGMLKKINDFSTYGKVSERVLKKLLELRLRRKDGKKVSSELINKVIKAINSGKLMKDVEEVVPYLRLHPPRKGFKGVKKHVRQGGSLGKRDSIDDLLEKMM